MGPISWYVALSSEQRAKGPRGRKSSVDSYSATYQNVPRSIKIDIFVLNLFLENTVAELPNLWVHWLAAKAVAGSLSLGDN